MKQRGNVFLYKVYSNNKAAAISRKMSIKNIKFNCDSSNLTENEEIKKIKREKLEKEYRELNREVIDLKSEVNNLYNLKFIISIHENRLKELNKKSMN